MTAPVVHDDTTDRWLRNGAMWSVGLFIVGIIMGLIFWGSSVPAQATSDGGSPSPTPQETTAVTTGGSTTTVTESPSPTTGSSPPSGGGSGAEAAQAHFTVDNSTVKCVALTTKYYGSDAVVTLTDSAHKGQKTPMFVRYALQGLSGSSPHRLWSDSVNVPLAVDARTLQGGQASVCHDLSQAAQGFQALGSVEIGGKRIDMLNKAWWPKDVSEWSAECWTDSVETHLECAKTMSYLATLLQQFASAGVKQVPVTTWNMHRAGPVVGSIPDFVRNPVQEKDGYFIVLQWTEKTGGCWARIGINVGRASGINGGDQRFAGLPCVAPKPPAQPKPSSTPTTVPPTQVTQPSHPHSTPPTTAPSTRPSTPTTPTTVPTKSTCACIAKASASQKPLPPPKQTQKVPSKAPSAQPTHSAPPPDARSTDPRQTAAPSPTSGGYNGGSTSQPGTTAPPTTVVPTTAPPNTGDPGGF